MVCKGRGASNGPHWSLVSREIFVGTYMGYELKNTKTQIHKYTNPTGTNTQKHPRLVSREMLVGTEELLHRQRTEQGSPSSAFNISIQIHEIYVEGHFNILYLMYLYTSTSDIEGHFNTNTSDIHRKAVIISGIAKCASKTPSHRE